MESRYPTLETMEQRVINHYSLNVKIISSDILNIYQTHEKLDERIVCSLINYTRCAKSNSPLILLCLIDDIMSTAIERGIPLSAVTFYHFFCEYQSQLDQILQSHSQFKLLFKKEVIAKLEKLVNSAISQLNKEIKNPSYPHNIAQLEETKNAINGFLDHIGQNKTAGTISRYDTPFLQKVINEAREQLELTEILLSKKSKSKPSAESKSLPVHISKLPLLTASAQPVPLYASTQLSLFQSSSIRTKPELIEIITERVMSKKGDFQNITYKNITSIFRNSSNFIDNKAIDILLDYVMLTDRKSEFKLSRTPACLFVIMDMALNKAIDLDLENYIHFFNHFSLLVNEISKSKDCRFVTSHLYFVSDYQIDLIKRFLDAAVTQLVKIPLTSREDILHVLSKIQTIKIFLWDYHNSVRVDDNLPRYIEWLGFKKSTIDDHFAVLYDHEAFASEALKTMPQPECSASHTMTKSSQKFGFS